jgi:flagellar hook-associated protein 3 FlgL
MEVTFQLLDQSVAAANSAEQQFAVAEEQVSSGKAYQVPSDNPSAVQDTVVQDAALGTINSYLAAGNAVAANQSAADSTLSDILTKITSAISQATASQGSPVSQAAQAAASDAIAGLRDAVASDINTSVNGVSLFAGGQTNQTAYVQTGSGWVYQGDGENVQLAIDSSQSVAQTWNGQAIFQGSAGQNVLDTLDQLATDVQNGNTSGISTDITALQAAFSRVSAAQSALGADENSVTNAQSKLNALQLATQARVSQDSDVNMVNATTQMNQAQIAYEAALAAVSRIGQVSLLDYLY